MMARATTTAVQQPMAWTKRARDQPAQARRQRAGQSGDQVQGEAADQHRPAAIAVGQRAADQLRGAETEDEQGQRLLHRRRADAEIQCHAGQRGQVKVGRQRLQHHATGDQPEQGGGAHRFAHRARLISHGDHA
jgi:hypothetical protein